MEFGVLLLVIIVVTVAVGAEVVVPVLEDVDEVGSARPRVIGWDR